MDDEVISVSLVIKASDITKEKKKNKKKNL